MGKARGWAVLAEAGGSLSGQAMAPSVLRGQRAPGQSVEGETSVGGVPPTGPVTSPVPPPPGSLPWSPRQGGARPLLLAQHHRVSIIPLWAASLPGGWRLCAGPGSVSGGGSARVWELVVNGADGQGAQGSGVVGKGEEAGSCLALEDVLREPQPRAFWVGGTRPRREGGDKQEVTFPHRRDGPDSWWREGTCFLPIFSAPVPLAASRSL